MHFSLFPSLAFVLRFYLQRQKDAFGALFLVDGSEEQCLNFFALKTSPNYGISNEMHYALYSECFSYLYTVPTEDTHSVVLPTFVLRTLSE
jgi:hypothetical protein